MPSLANTMKGGPLRNAIERTVPSDGLWSDSKGIAADIINLGFGWNRSSHPNRDATLQARQIVTYVHKGALDGSVTFPGSRRWTSWVRRSGAGA
jgi:hypothetical protein